MMFGTDVNETYLDRIYEDFRTEQQSQMEKIKQDVETTAQQDITKGITLLSSLMMTILRYRNLKRKMRLKLNC